MPRRRRTPRMNRWRIHNRWVSRLHYWMEQTGVEVLPGEGAGVDLIVGGQRRVGVRVSRTQTVDHVVHAGGREYRYTYRRWTWNLDARRKPDVWALVNPDEKLWLIIPHRAVRQERAITLSPTPAGRRRSRLWRYAYAWHLLFPDSRRPGGVRRRNPV